MMAKIPKEIPRFSKSDPNVVDKLVDWIENSESREEEKKFFIAEAKQAWNIIEHIDKLHSGEVFTPYTDREIKIIIEIANKLMNRARSLNFDEVSKQLFEAHAGIYSNYEKFTETEIVITINRIKDIIHQIFEPRFETKKKEAKDLSIEGFPRFSTGKSKAEYKQVYEKRLFWFADVLKDKLGEKFADALYTMDHDINEFSLNISHLAYTDILKDRILDRAVDKKLITEKQRVKILEAIIHCFATKTLTSKDDPDWEKKNAKIEDIVSEKIRAIDKKLEKE